MPSSMSIVCTTRRYHVSAPKIRQMASLICCRLGVADHELSIRLVGERSIRRLNRDFRHIDKETDVLSFPQIDWRRPLAVLGKAAGARLAAAAAPLSPSLPVLGDLVIALPVAERNAQRIGQALDRELGFLLVHGILHLCGHDHQTHAEEQRMRQAQRVLMRALAGTKGTKPLWSSSVKPRRKRQPHAH